jgi:hypothetical protein
MAFKFFNKDSDDLVIGFFEIEVEKNKGGNFGTVAFIYMGELLEYHLEGIKKHSKKAPRIKNILMDSKIFFEKQLGQTPQKVDRGSLKEILSSSTIPFTEEIKNWFRFKNVNIENYSKILKDFTEKHDGFICAGNIPFAPCEEQRTKKVEL